MRTVGTISNRDGVGARVQVSAGDDVQTQEVYAGSSIISAHSKVLTFGLGKRPQGTVDVRWPSGIRNRLYNVRAGEDIAFPEIPCSYADPAADFQAYRQCVTGALAQLQQEGVVQPHQHGRFLSSAIRAWQDAH